MDQTHLTYNCLHLYHRSQKIKGDQQSVKYSFIFMLVNIICLIDIYEVDNKKLSKQAYTVYNI